MDVENRIRRLESMLKWTFFSFFVFVLSVIFFIFPSLTKDKIHGDSVELETSNGKDWAYLKNWGGKRISGSVWGSAGYGMGIHVDECQSRLTLDGKSGDNKLVFLVSNETGLKIYDKEKICRVSLSISSGKPALVFFDKSGKVVCKIPEN